ncbi:MAG: type II toxin-antitoxin system HicB family antitoxin [Nanoarchaeota archaeon]|nr:type II toxin-antitoxin system HicB family antitoxin [Nanoarchaeota archaeon]
MQIKIMLEEQEEGGYTAFVPSLVGCISQGDTVEESLKNIKEAIQLWLEPNENELIIYKDNVKVETITI